MKTIIFLGSTIIGLKCLKFLVENEQKLNIKVIGVLTPETVCFDVRSDIKGFAKKQNIPVIPDLDEIISMNNVDFLISVQYHKILKQHHINTARELAINLHMAPLPEYRGCNQFSYAILNDDDEFGTTIHKLDTTIDGGPIIAERRFLIPKNIFIAELYDLTVNESIKLFEESIDDILSNKYKLTPQSTLFTGRKTTFHYRKEIHDLKQIDLSWSKDKIVRTIRATCMPGFEPPYIIINGKKIYFIPEDQYGHQNQTN